MEESPKFEYDNKYNDDHNRISFSSKLKIDTSNVTKTLFLVSLIILLSHSLLNRVYSSANSKFLIIFIKMAAKSILYANKNAFTTN